MTCERAIDALLSGLVSTRCYPMVAPQQSARPFIIYQRIDSERWRSINNPAGIAQALIQVDAYADSYNDVKALASDIENILDGYRGSVNYGDNSPQSTIEICGITLQSDIDSLEQTEEPFMFRNIARYLVTYKQ